MLELMENWLARLRRGEFAAQSAALALASLAGWLLLAAAAVLVAGPKGWLATTLAAGSCWLGAQSALILCRPLGWSQGASKTIFLGMLFRMGIPLATAAASSRILPPAVLASLGGLSYLMVLLVVFYQWTLATEVALLWLGRQPAPEQG
jgi:hypothetical protein